MPPRRQAAKKDSTIGIEADFGKEHAGTFRNVQHPDLRADYVLANGSVSSNQSGEGEIRRIFRNFCPGLKFIFVQISPYQ